MSSVAQYTWRHDTLCCSRGPTKASQPFHIQISQFRGTLLFIVYKTLGHIILSAALHSIYSQLCIILKNIHCIWMEFLEPISNLKHGSSWIKISLDLTHVVDTFVMILLCKYIWQERVVTWRELLIYINNLQIYILYS